MAEGGPSPAQVQGHIDDLVKLGWIKLLLGSIDIIIFIMMMVSDPLWSGEIFLIISTTLFALVWKSSLDDVENGIGEEGDAKGIQARKIIELVIRIGLAFGTPFLMEGHLTVAEISGSPIPAFFGILAGLMGLKNVLPMGKQIVGMLNKLLIGYDLDDEVKNYKKFLAKL